jgi:transposase-like protein
LRDGTRDILGIWIENTEGAKFWLKVFKDLKTRGVDDVLIAVTDGLKGVPEALAAAFPRTTLQTCVVHLIRNSLEFAGWKDRKPLAAALRPIIARRRSPPRTSLFASHTEIRTPPKNGPRCTRRPFFLTLEAHQRPTQIRTDRLPGSS